MVLASQEPRVRDGGGAQAAGSKVQGGAGASAGRMVGDVSSRAGTEAVSTRTAI